MSYFLVFINISDMFDRCLIKVSGMHADFQGAGLYTHCAQSLPQRLEASKYIGLFICLYIVRFILKKVLDNQYVWLWCHSVYIPGGSSYTPSEAMWFWKCKSSSRSYFALVCLVLCPSFFTHHCLLYRQSINLECQPITYQWP